MISTHPSYSRHNLGWGDEVRKEMLGGTLYIFAYFLGFSFHCLAGVMTHSL